MDPETKHFGIPSAAYDAAARAVASLAPLGNIHQHLCGFHVYAQDRTRHVEAHHLCSRIKPDFYQCIIYDSGTKDAKLIGIEYVIGEKVFKTLPEEEKKYWHSHKYEVESGLQYLDTIAVITHAMNDQLEKTTMGELQKTYGKAVHTWAIDKYPDLPLGPPQLMMSYTEGGQLSDDFIKERDKRLGVSTESKGKYRAGYLEKFEKDEKSDQWEKSGTGIAFEANEVKLQD